jgi:uncharacterized damage-inducible protein DinB
MLTDHELTRTYLLSSIEGAPELFGRLLNGAVGDEFDYRPEPGRFSIREILAHLADWEEIWLMRMTLTRDEHEPLLASIDVGQLAIDRDYSHRDHVEQLRLFGVRRAALADFVRSLTRADWARVCVRPDIGRVTMEGLAVFVTLHDSYHVRQVAEWRERYRGRDAGRNG